MRAAVVASLVSPIRAAIRRRAQRELGVDRMVDAYERGLRAVVGGHQPTAVAS